MKKFRSFEDTKIFVHSLKLKNEKEWMNYKKSGKKPEDIPSTPHIVYKNQGWIGLGDWLGTGRIANQNRKFKKIEDARKISRKLRIKSRTDWYQYVKNHTLPNGVPRAPDSVYKNKGWISWGDWLGTGYEKNKKFRNFVDAKNFVHRLGLKSQLEWNDLKQSGKLPHDIPRDPRTVYSKTGEWKNTQDWLGYKTRRILTGQHRNFVDAKNFVHSLGFKNQSDWKKYVKSGKKPDDIPVYPQGVYKKQGWKNMGDWLGTGNIQNQQRKFRNFVDAREYVRKLKLQSLTEWRQYCKSDNKPLDIPSDPRVYQEYTTAGDWLGTDTIAQSKLKWLSYPDAKKIIKEIAQKNNLKTKEDWKLFTKNHKLPEGIPKHPWAVYAKIKRKQK